jgi:fission process protein 1
MARLRTINMALMKAKRYLAYSSDVGEAFRPIVNPKVVTFSYGLSWAYVLGESFYMAY